MPTPEAEDWNCKYQILATEDLISQLKKENKEVGYIMVQIEQYGFDEEVSIIVQPKNAFFDIGKGPDNKIVSTHQVTFGDRFFVPAEEYQILVNFKPVDFYQDDEKKEKSYMGRLKLRSQYVQNINSTDRNSESSIIYWKSKELD